jgi:outer membrane protein OmpA-like peptidoglycan-associated protein
MCRSVVEARKGQVMKRHLMKTGCLLLLSTFFWIGKPVEAVGEKDTVPDQILTWKDIDGKVLDLVFTVKDLGGKVQDLQIKETATEIVIELAADVLFDFDKAVIKSEAAAALKQAATVIRDKAKGIVRIEGYTDSKGSDAYNQKLSERRAIAVKTWLVKKEELKNVRFETHGFGAKKPVAPNTRPDGSDDPDGRRKNRRVEIILKK